MPPVPPPPDARQHVLPERLLLAPRFQESITFRVHLCALTHGSRQRDKPQAEDESAVSELKSRGRARVKRIKRRGGEKPKRERERESGCVWRGWTAKY